MIRAGNLEHLVTIQQATETRGADGSVIQTWGTLGTEWAEISPKQGDEKYAAQGIIAEVVHEIRMHYRSTVTPKMRILYGARVFEIQSVLNWREASAEMLLVCLELV